MTLLSPVPVRSASFGEQQLRSLNATPDASSHSKIRSQSSIQFFESPRNSIDCDIDKSRTLNCKNPQPSEVESTLGRVPLRILSFSPDIDD
ncbi:hypothetical protein P9112_011400 [Eukaryota sp. TZLM1-RC]